MKKEQQIVSKTQNEFMKPELKERKKDKNNSTRQMLKELNKKKQT